MVAAYNALYKSMSSTDPHAFTNTGSIDAKQLDYNVQVFTNKFEESRPPENSKWYATYEKMHPVISPIGNPAAILGNAVDITIPEAREWLARFTNSNGEITYMADFRKGYPGVRP